MDVKEIISSGLLELYVLGTATEDECLQVEKWIQQYPEVKQEIESMQEAMESYAISHAIEPDPAVKDRLMQKISGPTSASGASSANSSSSVSSSADSGNLTVVRSEDEAPYAIGNDRGRFSTLNQYFKWAAAACFILLLGSLILNYLFYTKYYNLVDEIRVAYKQVGEKDQVAKQLSRDLEVMTDKNALPITLNGTEKAPDALARIYWMKNTGEVYIDPKNLPPPPAGKQYQLWAILDGKPLDGGMIETKQGVYHIQKMKTFGKAEAFAITLEKAGGSVTPSADMVVIAKI